MQPYILLALGSALCGAVATSLARTIMKYCGNAPEDYMPVHYAVLSAGLLPLLPLLWKLELAGPTAAVLCVLFLTEAAANYLYIRSFAMQKARRISVIMALSPLFGMALMPLGRGTVGDPLGMGQVAGIGIIFLGLWFMSGEWGRYTAEEKDASGDTGTGLLYTLDAFRERLVDSASRVGHRRILFPVAAAALMALNALLAKYLFQSGATNPYTFFTLRCVVLALIFSVLFRPNFKEFLRKDETARWVYVRAAFVAAQWLLLLYAVAAGNPVVASAAGNTIPLFVLPVAFIGWGKRARWYEVAGTAVVTAGVLVVMLG